MSAEIVDHQLADCGARLQRGAAVMRLHVAISQLQYLGGWRRLALEHVERGMAETPRLERCDQRRLIDHAAARDVDQRSFWTERVDDGSRDEVAGLCPAFAGNHQI